MGRQEQGHRAAIIAYRTQNLRRGVHYPQVVRSAEIINQFSQYSLCCQTYPAVSNRITHLDNHKVWELYCFDTPEEKRIAVRGLIDLIIHSFIFSECLRDDMTIDGFFVASDRWRYDRLWFVEIRVFVGIMRDIGTDYPPSGTRVFNREKNDWETWQGYGDPPLGFQRRMKKILREQWGVDRSDDQDEPV